jgi:hypothetical protein
MKGTSFSPYIKALAFLSVIPGRESAVLLCIIKGLYGLQKKLPSVAIHEGFVKGHYFSRAVEARKQRRALAPESRIITDRRGEQIWR